MSIIAETRPDNLKGEKKQGKRLCVLMWLCAAYDVLNRPTLEAAKSDRNMGRKFCRVVDIGEPILYKAHYILYNVCYRA